jgi:hypothetical protein
VSELPTLADGDEMAWDYDLPPFGVLVEALADIEPGDDEPDAAAETMEIEGITLSLAIELAVRETDGGAPVVRGSTPTQWTETTVLPVFHRLTMHIVREELRDA